MSMPLQRTVSEGLTPLPAAYSGPAASDHPPQPFEDLRDHVAGQQQCRRPDQRRYEIGDLKVPVGHLEYPGSERHRGAQGSEKPSNKDAGHAPVFHEDFAARQDLGITRQRPHLRDLFLVFEAEPVGDPVAKRSADAAGNPDRPEADAAGADQRPDRDQCAPGRDQERYEGQRFAERQQQNDRSSPDPMVAHEIGHGVREIFHLPDVSPGPCSLSEQGLEPLWGSDARDQVSQPPRRHQVTKMGTVREPPALPNGFPPAKRNEEAGLRGSETTSSQLGSDDAAPCPPSSLFVLIRGIVRETDSRRSVRARNT